MAHQTKLEFPVKTFTVTDKYGKVTTHTTRQTTIGNVIWTDADITYYETLQKLLAEGTQINKQLEKLYQSNMVSELINEITNEDMYAKGS